MRKSKERNLTQKIVKDLFDYTDDGCLIRKTSESWNTNAGDVVGWPSHGYLSVGIGMSQYFVHRIIWLWNKGYLPENEIDHIDRNRLNNRIENLREVNSMCNKRNTGLFKNNTSRVKGVVFYAKRNKWTAQISLNNRTRSLGRYSDFLEAVCHRLAAEQCLGWDSCDKESTAYKYVKTKCSTSVS